MQIKKGQLIQFTDGEYSDYCTRFFGRALRDFETQQTVEDLKRAGMYEVMQEVWVYHNGKGHYVPPVKKLALSSIGVRERWFRFVVQEQVIEELDDVAEVHMGDTMGEFKPY